MRVPTLWIVVVVGLLLSSCAEQHKYAYLSDAPRGEAMPIQQSYLPVIMPGDRMLISVSSELPEVATIFNQEFYLQPAGTPSRNTRQTDELPGYEVNSSGNITFPQLGEVRAAGITADSLAHLIARRLREEGLVLDAQVSVRTTNFSVVVIGEVAQPGEVKSPTPRLTIFEALASVGDITIDGLPEYTTIVRRSLAGEVLDTVDLTSRTLLTSPYYYLQQGDIIFVPPTEKKRRMAYRNEDWPTYLSTGISAVTLAYNTIYRYLFDPQTKEIRENNRSNNR